MCSAMTRHEPGPAHIVDANSSRRPPRVRSMHGPNTGATIANGASVSRRYSSTFGRAAPGPTSKNSESASETVTKTSPATPIACASASAGERRERRRLEPAASVRVRHRTTATRPVTGQSGAGDGDAGRTYHCAMTLRTCRIAAAEQRPLSRPRALDARVQGARARARRGPGAAAARAREVPRDLQLAISTSSSRCASRV